MTTVPAPDPHDLEPAPGGGDADPPGAPGVPAGRPTPPPATRPLRRVSQEPDFDERLQAEIEAALGDMRLETMLDLDERPRRGPGPQRPRQETGLVVRIHGDDVFVEFGPKSQGVCPRSAFEDPPTVGEHYEFTIDRYDQKDGLLLLSRRGAARKAEWESLVAGQVVEARCVGVNKGGLELELAQHKAFMPAGQIDLRHIEDLTTFIGQKLPCEVIELDRSRGRIVLSRRRVLEAERAAQRESLLAVLKEGEQRDAVVRSIQPYGAFADLGGVDGLIHISDICHERLKHPSERLKEGDAVRVQVLKVDRAADPPRIGLGMKQCLADPYHEQAARLKEGATVTGRVSRITNFGAFVEIAPGVEGLIHISQLSEERVNRVQSVVRIDEVVTVKVLDIDQKNRRISLSLRAARKEQEPDVLRADDPGLKKLRARFGSDLRGGIG